jgi:hypothetical protein
MKHGHWSRGFGHVPYRRHHMIDGHAVKTIPIGAYIADTFVAGGHIRTYYQSVSQGLPPNRKIILPRIEQTDH